MRSSCDPIPETLEFRWRELALSEGNLLRVFACLRGGDSSWLLDSASVDGRLGRHSFAGADPYAVVRSFGREIEVDCRRPVRQGLAAGVRKQHGELFEWLKGMLPAFEVDDRELPIPLPFLGGAVGYWGYELAEQVESLDLRARDDLGLPDATLLLIDRLVALDHASGRCFAIGLGFGASTRDAADGAEQSLEELCAGLVPRLNASPEAAAATNGPPAGIDRGEILTVEVPGSAPGSFDAAGYRARVRELKREIAAGNVYEANLTRRMDLPFEGEGWLLYRALRQLSPAPFASFMELPDCSIVGSSPERFLRVSAAGDVESRPIKGTRPRGLSPEEDCALAADLSSSEKDRAENLMIVDLVRNDLGRVCELGSVEVPELMVVERYASVFQLVSTVVGKLRRGSDRMDLMRAAFPPGSMTGAPKIAAMRLLDAMEPLRRGVYAGALGYLDVRGGMDLAVVIRTLVLRNGFAHLHVGGAVVADSDPQQEYEESLDKARAMLAALQSAGRSAAGSSEPRERRVQDPEADAIRGLV